MEEKKRRRRVESRWAKERKVGVEVLFLSSSLFFVKTLLPMKKKKGVLCFERKGVVFVTFSREHATSEAIELPLSAQAVSREVWKRGELGGHASSSGPASWRRFLPLPSLSRHLFAKPEQTRQIDTSCKPEARMSFRHCSPWLAVGWCF